MYTGVSDRGLLLVVFTRSCCGSLIEYGLKRTKTQALIRTLADQSTGLLFTSVVWGQESVSVGDKSQTSRLNMILCCFRSITLSKSVPKVLTWRALALSGGSASYVIGGLTVLTIAHDRGFWGQDVAS